MVFKQQNGNDEIIDCGRVWYCGGCGLFFFAGLVVPRLFYPWLINDHDGGGRTALVDAAYKRDLVLVLWLIETHGADVSGPTVHNDMGVSGQFAEEG